MFDFLLCFMKAVLSALANENVRVYSISFNNNQYAEVLIEAGEAEGPALEFYVHPDTPDRIGVDVHLYDGSGKTAKLIFKSDMHLDEMVSVFMAFINVNKLKPPITAPVQESDKNLFSIKKSYFYVKRCRQCKERYFKNEIGKDNFEHLSGNENIVIYTADPKEYFAEIMSVCESCSK